VVDSGSPVTGFRAKDEMKAYLKRRRDTFTRTLVYRIDGEATWAFFEFGVVEASVPGSACGEPENSRKTRFSCWELNI
jgi:hypothetical protein